MSEPCPKCGGTDWSTASDGLGDIASVVATCIGCGYLKISLVDLGDPQDAHNGDLRPSQDGDGQ